MKILQVIAAALLFAVLCGCRAKNDGARYVKNDASAPDDQNLLAARAVIFHQAHSQNFWTASALAPDTPGGCFAIGEISRGPG